MRGCCAGRAAFETMRVYEGVPFRLNAHLARLVGSAEVLGLPAPDPARLAPLAMEAVAAAAVPGCVLRVVWTGGREAEQDGVGFALVTALPDGLEQQRQRGVALASLQLAIGAHARRSSPWLLPGVKSTSYAVNMAAQREAHRRGADDAVFLSAEGIVLEGPTSNVWFTEGEKLCTPGLDLGILAGVTRDTLLAAAADARDRGGGGRVCDRAAVRGRRGVHQLQRARGDAGGDAGRPRTVAGRQRRGRWRGQMQSALRADDLMAGLPVVLAGREPAAVGPAPQAVHVRQ